MNSQVDVLHHCQGYRIKDIICSISRPIFALKHWKGDTTCVPDQDVEVESMVALPIVSTCLTYSKFE